MEVTFKAYDMLHVWRFNTVLSGNILFSEIRRICSTAIIIDVKHGKLFNSVRKSLGTSIRTFRTNRVKCNGSYTRAKQSTLTRQVGKPAAIRFKKPETIQDIIRENYSND